MKHSPAFLAATAIGIAACDSSGELSDVTLDNARFRLVLSGNGYAKSLVVKATGEEMIEAGARVPFSTITQNRAYDNEFKLMYAAKPWTLPSDRIERVGNAFDVFENELQRKAMRKYILRTARQDADDFSPVNLGWLSMQPPKKPNPSGMKTSNAQYALSEFGNCTMGLQPDTVEYVACKAAAWRAPVGFKASPEKCRRHPRASECLAAFKRWEDAKLGNRFTGEQLEAFKDENREWFLWPFAPQDRPEPVEWRQITEDSKWLECPIRAFSYSRGGVSGIAYWRIDAAETPEIVLPGVETSSKRDKGLRFIEAEISEHALVSAFRNLRKKYPALW